QAFRQMTDRRPGPALLEVPLDIQRGPAPAGPFPEVVLPTLPLGPSLRDLDALVSLLESWQRPLLMVGGGACSAGAEEELAQLADRLGAPVFHTFMGKAALSSKHRLNARLPWRQATSDLTQMELQLSPLFS